MCHTLCITVGLLQRGQLDKVNQLDYQKIIIHSESELSIITTMKQNKQHGSKSTNCNLQTRPFEPAEQSMCFLRGSLEWMTEAKNINDSYNFDLRSHVSEKQGNRNKENAGR